MTMDVSRREVFRYMGLKGTPEKALERIVEESLAQLESVAEQKQIVRRFPLQWPAEQTLQIEGLRIESCDLARNLRGCREVFLMAATLGLGPDRLIARVEARGEMSRAMALQAAAAAMIEVWCDRVNASLREEVAAQGLCLHPRFSPGYGDFALSHQIGLFQLLEVQKRIGVTLSERLLMMPTKSVTAVIGIAEKALGDRPQGCAACPKADCAFRKA